MNADQRRLNEVTQQIIGCAFTVSNSLGCGFLEKVYENALAHELRKCGLSVQQQKSLTVYYDGEVVGEYFTDILVNDEILVEIKTVRALDDVHLAQCMNYLRGSRLRLCLLMNFAQPRLEYRRVANKF